LPEVSVVRHCLRRGLDVYLIEWLTPTEREDGFGLAEYADGLPAAALDAIAAETGCRSPLLAGHSLGGTFAAIFASLWPERVGGLVLLDAPLAFGARGRPLRARGRGRPPRPLDPRRGRYRRCPVRSSTR
jgi:polyhydroxyalkanoate synthase